MASKNQPASPEQAPDPSNSYERSHPQRESGMGRLDNNVATPANQPTSGDHAVKNRQPSRQLNAHEVDHERASPDDHGETGTGPVPGQRQPEEVKHSMHEDEPTGWDQAPTGSTDPSHKRHPRTGGKGGTPDAGEARRNG